MPDNVKSLLAISLRRLLRPLVKIMLREGFSYRQFAAIAQIAFVDSAAKDFGVKGMKTSASSICALTGMSLHQLEEVLSDQERFDTSDVSGPPNPFARVLHGWHNDRDYVGPYGFPVDIPFTGNSLSFTALVARHAPGVSPHVVLLELKRIGAVTEVGSNIWKPLAQEYIEPSLSSENIRRMASLVESLLSTLESNTRGARDGSELFERTMIVDAPLTATQMQSFQSYLRIVGGQFLQRVDAYAAVDLQEKMAPKPGEKAEVRTGLQCFMYVDPEPEESQLKSVIEMGL